MSILIAYASRHGFTKKCAEILAKKLDGNADICDLGSNKPDLSKYDKVIVGGSVYIGKILKSTARFCAANLDTLKVKKLGLFICGMAGENDAMAQLEANFPKELLAAAAAKGAFGGEFSFDNMNPLERFMIKKISGSDANQSCLREDNITSFAERMKKA